VQLTERGTELWAEMRRRQVPWANRTAEKVAVPALEATLRTLRALRARLKPRRDTAGFTSVEARRAAVPVDHH
jgi:hypothetical protein